MRPLAHLLLLTLLTYLPACASQYTAEFQSAISSTTPPPDFTLGVTVLRRPAEAGSRAAAYRSLPIPIRPARYIVETDRILRVAVGSGARESVFPDQTRQLTQSQFESLWETLRTSPLVEADHPARVAVGPDAESLGDRTVYIVTFSAAGARRTLSIPAATASSPESAEGAGDAAKLVEQLAGLAWMQ